MRAPAWVIVSACVLALFAPSARAQEHTWVVLSGGNLDERIERQLNMLAAADQALIRFSSGPAGKSQVVPAGGLAIELRSEQNAEAFLEALKQKAGTTEIAPTPELAEQGYIIEADYPRAAAPTGCASRRQAPRDFTTPCCEFRICSRSRPRVYRAS